MSAPPVRHVVILGLMGCGKTSVGRALASRLGRPLRDNDVELGRVIGTTASQHAATHGLADLHRIEAEVLQASLDGAEPAVVTVAASLGDRADLPQLLAGHDVVWLDVDPMELAARTEGGDDHRPVQRDAYTQLVAQRQRRAPNFRAAADLVLTWRHETPEQLADRIADHLARAHPAAGR